MEFELSWTNEITIMILKPFYSGSGIIRMQDVLGCGTFGMWEVQNVKCLGC